MLNKHRKKNYKAVIKPTKLEQAPIESKQNCFHQKKLETRKDRSRPSKHTPKKIISSYDAIQRHKADMI